MVGVGAAVGVVCGGGSGVVWGWGAGAVAGDGGAGLLFEAVVRTYMVYVLPVERFLAISPFVLYGITGALIALSVWQGKRARRRGDARRQVEAAN